MIPFPGAVHDNRKPSLAACGPCWREKGWHPPIPAKVTGGEAYLQDMRLPGMLHARVARGPSDGTRLRAADIEAVGRLPGVVEVVRQGRFTAVIADDEWRAVKALHRLQAAGWERVGAPLPAQDMRETIRALPAEEMPIFDNPGPPAPPGPRRPARAR